MNNPGIASYIGTTNGTAAVSKNPKSASCTILDVVKFYHTGSEIFFGKFVWRFRY